MSQDEKIRWHAAKSLIVRRLERDKIELKAQSRDSRPPLSSEAQELLYFLDGQSNEQLEDAINSVRSLALPASGEAEVCI